MVVVPGVMPVSAPVPDIVPTARLELTQPPPLGVLLSSVVLPVHTLSVPLMADGIGFTVTFVDTLQPLRSVYTAVHMPGPVPVMAPDELTVAMPGHGPAQVPPDGSALSVVPSPWQNDVVPDMEPGSGFTVTMVEVVQPLGSV